MAGGHFAIVVEPIFAGVSSPIAVREAGERERKERKKQISCTAEWGRERKRKEKKKKFRVHPPSLYQREIPQSCQRFLPPFKISVPLALLFFFFSRPAWTLSSFVTAKLTEPKVMSLNAVRDVVSLCGATIPIGGFGGGPAGSRTASDIEALSLWSCRPEMKGKRRAGTPMCFICRAAARSSIVRGGGGEMLKRRRRGGVEWRKQEI